MFTTLYLYHSLQLLLSVFQDHVRVMIPLVAAGHVQRKRIMDKNGTNVS
jgi:hypothetical protein